MITIWKYEVQLGLTKDTEEKLALWEREMPESSQVLSIQSQFGQIVMWVMVDTNSKIVTRSFKIFATGEEIPTPTYPKQWHHRGTIQIDSGRWTWHLLELK